jgi:hypothetical protein
MRYLGAKSSGAEAIGLARGGGQQMLVRPAAGKEGYKVIQAKDHQHGRSHVLQKLFSSYLCVEFLAQVVAHFVFPPVF